MIKKSLIVALSTLILLLLLSACGGQAGQTGQPAGTPPDQITPAPPAVALPTPIPAPPAPTTGTGTGNLAPDFTLTNLDGKTVSLSDFRGKLVWLNFWATW